MPTGNEPIILREDGWVFRVQSPATPEPTSPVMLLIHGLSGDENVMWIFTRNLPRNYWLIAPRGPILTSSGYAWIEKSPSSRPHLLDLSSLAASLMDFLERWKEKNNVTTQAVDIMGFSQGAAIAYALAAFYPGNIHRIIALAGFLPQEDNLPGRYSVLKDKPVYIAHGSKDEIVPVTMAEEAVQVLTACGAAVTYCESETGHKLSTGCLRGLEAFVSKNSQNM